jgi:hypothetical protein
VGQACDDGGLCREFSEIAASEYRLKDHAAIAGKEDKNKKPKSKPNEPSTAEPAS